MYTYEIDNIIRKYNYTLPSYVYSEICKTSPQINWIKYTPYDDSFEIATSDGGYWKFSVYMKD